MDALKTMVMMMIIIAFVRILPGIFRANKSLNIRAYYVAGFGSAARCHFVCSTIAGINLFPFAYMHTMHSKNIRLACTQCVLNVDDAIFIVFHSMQ